MPKRSYISIGVFFIILLMIYCWRYYPQQQISATEVSRIEVLTPDTTKYRNDCLHPCIRYSSKGFAGYHYWMVQSPYYAWNSGVENPILYRSNSLDSIGLSGLLIADSPQTGYNSDPNLYIDGDSVLYVFWRECGTPLCDSLGYSPITVGVSTRDGEHFSGKRVYMKNAWSKGDTEQAPVLIKHGEEYWFYAAWYEYEPKRQNRGIAIWKGTSLTEPDFFLTDTIPFESLYVCDKAAEVRINGYRLYCPKPQYFDLWHFDLWEKEDGALSMIASTEKGDMIMLAESTDGMHFSLTRKPLVMNHYMENYVGYRQYYYKPSAFVKDDTLHLFYTANDQYNPSKNILFHAKKSIKAY